MSTRRRNHFIPRFLLNRFASRVDGNKHWVWQLSRDSDPKEISTRDAAVQSDFYGSVATGVEDAFSVIEGKLNYVLLELDGGAPPTTYADELRGLVWTLAIRTLALRKQFAETTNALVHHLVESANSEDTRTVLFQYFKQNFDDFMSEALANRPSTQRFALRALFRLPFVRERILRWAQERVESVDLRAFSMQLQAALQSGDVFERSAQTGQVRGLGRLLAANRVPDTFAPTHWEVSSAEPHSVILGDACVVAVSTAGEIGSLLRFGDSCGTLYLPISHSQVLVARRGTMAGSLSVEDLNQASAKISWSYLFSSRLPVGAASLTSLIGEGDAVISSRELATVLEGVWSPTRQW